jgi:hypothetical protein
MRSRKQIRQGEELLLVVSCGAQYLFRNVHGNGIWSGSCRL